MTEFIVNGKVEGSHLEPYVIAEIGVNHEGSLDTAKSMIDEIASAGGHAAKFQTYKAENLAAKISPAYWDLGKEPTTSQRELFKKYDSFGPEEYAALAEHCESKGIDFLSTPFDIDAVGMLNPLVKFFKVASADLLNIPLLRAVARTGKPIVVSTGAATIAEIQVSLDTMLKAGASTICLLHCVLNYPTEEENAHIANIKLLESCFPGMAIGYSDHVVPDATLCALDLATIMGAVVVEKHFTNDKSLPGNDHYHAMDGMDLATFISRTNRFRKLFGTEHRDVGQEESARLHARRSIVAASDIAPGELLTEENLTTKRPGTGVSSVHWDDVLGAVAAKKITGDSLIKWSDIKADE